jgi:hypothetical protein
MFPSTHLKKERGPVSEKLCSSYLEFRTIDKGHNPSISESLFSVYITFVLLIYGTFS